MCDFATNAERKKNNEEEKGKLRCQLKVGDQPKSKQTRKEE